MSKTSLKGAAFEYFVRRVLLSCGFKPVASDGFFIYDFGPGQMIHGLGQPHNADVLVEPYIQIPFYNTTRLIVECKCYEEALGIEFVRNVLGLRTDVNSFDIVTPDILNARRNYRSSKSKVYDMERYNYQVGLASFNGFKNTAQALALTHKIPLISFASETFKQIKKAVFHLDNIQLNKDETDALMAFFHGRENVLYDYRIFSNTSEIIKWYHDFIDEINMLLQHLNIGITNSGAILFLYKTNNRPSRDMYDGYRLFWSQEHKYWFLDVDENRYVFELPNLLLDEWARNAEESNKSIAALNLKEQAMSNIVLYEMEFGRPKIKVLNISNQFIIDARKRINEE